MRAHGVVVSHPLRMRKALGSNPSVSIFQPAAYLPRAYTSNATTALRQNYVLPPGIDSSDVLPAFDIFFFCRLQRARGTWSTPSCFATSCPRNALFDGRGPHADVIFGERKPRRSTRAQPNLPHQLGQVEKYPNRWRSATQRRPLPVSARRLAKPQTCNCYRHHCRQAIARPRRSREARFGLSAGAT